MQGDVRRHPDWQTKLYRPEDSIVSSLPQLDDFPTMPGKEQELLVVAALTDAKA